MQRFETTIINQIGHVVAGASFAVYQAGTMTLASLFSDNGVTSASNPVTADSNGRVAFFVANGSYDLVVSGSGITTYTRFAYPISTVLVPRDGLVLDANSNLDNYNIDPTISYFKDDFFPSGGIGELGWSTISGSSAPTYTYVAGTFPRVGVLKVRTVGTLTMAYPSNTIDFIGSLQSGNPFDCYFIFKLEQTTNTAFRAGVASPEGTGGLSTIRPSDGLFMRYDTQAAFADTAFKFVSVVGGVPTVLASMVVDTNWHKLRIYTTPDGTKMNFDVDGVNKANIVVSSVSSLGMSMFLGFASVNSIGAVVCDIDYAAARARGLSR